MAIAAVPAYAAFCGGDVQKGILITVGVALAGMALGRIVSAVVDDRTPSYPNWFLLPRRGGGRGGTVRRQLDEIRAT